VCNGEIHPTLVLFSSYPLFRLHVSVNSQDNRFSTEIGEVSLDDVNLVCGVLQVVLGLLAQFFLLKTINSHQYVTF
jgi:hypothetical protein